MVRAKFNAGQCVERAARDELHVRVTRRSKETPAERNQLPGTVTEVLKYATPQGQQVAVAVQYRRPDGTIGGPGRPDPKWLLDGSEALLLSHEGEESCPECPVWRPLALGARSET